MYLVNKCVKVEGDTSLLTFKEHSVEQTLIRAKFSPPDNTGQSYVYVGDTYGKVIGK